MINLSILLNNTPKEAIRYFSSADVEKAFETIHSLKQCILFDLFHQNEKYQNCRDSTSHLMKLCNLSKQKYPELYLQPATEETFRLFLKMEVRLFQVQKCLEAGNKTTEFWFEF